MRAVRRIFLIAGIVFYVYSCPLKCHSEGIICEVAYGVCLNGIALNKHTQNSSLLSPRSFQNEPMANSVFCHVI